jgi:hypothetical protein
MATGDEKRIRKVIAVKFANGVTPCCAISGQHSSYSIAATRIAKTTEQVSAP